jgi:hypothetical protein
MESTPFYADKSWWLVVCSIVAMLAARYIKVDVSAADLASVAVMVGSYVYSSKSKQAKVLAAQAEFQPLPAPVAPVPAPVVAVAPAVPEVK